MVYFCKENDLVITNTWYKQHPRRLYTWVSPGPGDLYRNQIDYSMVYSSFRNAVKSVKTYHGADVGSDHVPVVMSIRLRLKKLARGRKTTRRNLEILRDEDIRQTFSIKPNNRYEELMCEEPMQLDDQMIESVWKNLKSSIEEVVEEMIPKRPKEKKQKLMTDEIMQLMKERRVKED